MKAIAALTVIGMFCLFFAPTLAWHPTALHSSPDTPKSPRRFLLLAAVAVSASSLPVSRLVSERVHLVPPPPPHVVGVHEFECTWLC